MNILARLFNRQNAYLDAPTSQTMQAMPIAPYRTIMRGDLDDYSAAFPSVRPLVERFAMVVPYATRDGQKLDPQPIALQKLYTPNDDMSIYDFMDYLASTVLTQSTALIRVQFGHPDQAKHRSDDIIGYTFLPPSCREIVNGQVQYRFINSLGQQEIIYRDEVMEFTYANSTDQWGIGISPIQTVKKWATVADYIADYQAGYFQNGAKPDGTFIITAPSYAKYQATVAELEKVHRRGSRGHHNYQYSYRPVDEAGKPLTTANIEFVKYGVDNKDLAMKDLLDNAQSKLDQAYGVPAIARGDDSQATYSNAQVADVNVANKVNYLLTKVWFRFWFELDRICSDTIDWSIAYDYEVPALADAEKVQAETDQTNMTTLITAVNAGASVQSVVKALSLPESWNSLTITKQETPALPAETPQETQQPTIAINTHCGHRHESTDELDADSEYLEHHPGIDIATNRRYKGDKLTPRQELTQLVIRENKRILKNIIASKNAYGDPTQEEVEAFAENMAKILNPIRYEVGNVTARTIFRDLGLKIPGDLNDIMGLFDPRYEKRLALVARDHDKSVAAAIRDVLAKADLEGWTKAQTEIALWDFTSLKRADILARNELIASERFGSMDAAQALAEANDVKLAKVWAVNPGACDICKKLEGKQVAIDEPFIAKGGTLQVGDKVHVFDWAPLDITQAHTNCRCYPTWQVIEG